MVAEWPRTLMVGNSLREDVLGAQAAGLEVLLDRGDHHRDADVRRVRSLHDLVFAA
ncbi:HAD hydrolase-like protein [Krasilnikovia sp. MM14-A1259]|uniref:HAD hydrolase-like protein n=1 Tax=Krasilnikovia sp. MM14-A1259 TaxID=3373539 RepID=UPI00399D51DF